MNRRRSRTQPLPFDIRHQPDDRACGPTCLQAVYRYFGDSVSHEELVAGIPELEEGGTLGARLGTDALARGYRATLVTWNLQVFDPTWFEPGAPPLRERLLQRAAARPDDPKLGIVAQAYVEFLDRGGRIELSDLDPGLLRRALRRRVPILTGLSATYLYREARECPSDCKPDDVGGDPVGHFVVLTGYDSSKREVLVSDPEHPNPLSKIHTYPVPIERLIGALYLGVLTYDGNLMMIEPAGRGSKAAD
jgi:hypothetical protein